MISELDSRARSIFASLVETYLATGEPVGSRTLARQLEQAGLASLSPASIRNVMADLEATGLLYAPHTSAGRVPTELGLKLFVDGILQLGDLSAQERKDIEGRCQTAGKSLTDALGEATAMLSGLSASAALVAVPTIDRPLRHIEFVPLAAGRALVVLVTDDGQVENRVIEIPLGVPAATLTMASNFLAARLVGHTLQDAHKRIAEELAVRKNELDELTQKVITAGVGVWSSAGSGQLIVRGQAQLLNNLDAASDLEQLRGLFAALETVENVERLLASTKQADGVKVFIGAESGLFSHTGCALVVSPLLGANNAVIGAIGVIGPTRLNYGRIVPLVDYTARTLRKVIGASE
jgi:heat-inducible transcriptional repressor